MFNQNNSIADKKLQLQFISLTALCWLIMKIIGWKVWITERLFAVVPPFNFLHVPALYHWLLLIFSILLLAILIFAPQKKTIQIALLISELFSCSLDQNRWHPWEYFFIFILFINILNNNRAFITGIIFIIAATYFYSGVSKLNAGFLYSVWDNSILLHFFKCTPTFIAQPLIFKSGYALGLVELSCGIGLLFSSTKKIAAIVLIVMHLFILLLIGPFGLKYNMLVWPWNILMIALLILIFLQKTDYQIEWNILLKKWNILVLICWGVLPILSYVGLWDNYLSAKIYAGNLPQMVICISDTTTAKNYANYCSTDKFQMCTGTALLNVQNWAYKEMGVNACPEIRLYKKIKEKWMNDHPFSTDKFILFYYTDTGVVKQEMK